MQHSISISNHTVYRRLRSLEQHDHRADQARDASIRTCNRNQQYDACCGQIEEYERENEFPEGCHCRNKADQSIHNTPEEQWGNNT